MEDQNHPIQTLIQQADQYFNNSEFKKAEQIYRKVLSIENDHSLANYKCALSIVRTLEKEQPSTEVEGMFAKAIQKEDENFYFNYEFAKYLYYHAQDKKKQAGVLFLKSGALLPEQGQNSEQILQELTEMMHLTEHFDTAKKIYESVLEKGYNWRIVEKYLHLLIDMRQFQRAKQLYEKAFQLLPEANDQRLLAYERYLQILYLVDEEDILKETLRKMKNQFANNKKTYKILALFAAHFSNSQQYKLASSIVLMSLRNQPDLSSNSESGLPFSFTSLKEYEIVCKKMIEKFPFYEEGFTLYASLLYKKGLAKSAEDVYEDGLKKNDGSVKILSEYAHFLYQLEEYKKCDLIYDKIYELDGIYSYNYALFQKAAKNKEKQQMYESLAISDRPLISNFSEKYGQQYEKYYEEINKMRDIQFILEKVRSLEENNPQIYFIDAYFLDNVGRKEEAFELFNKCLYYDKYENVFYLLFAGQCFYQVRDYMHSTKYFEKAKSILSDKKREFNFNAYEMKGQIMEFFLKFKKIERFGNEDYADAQIKAEINSLKQMFSQNFSLLLTDYKQKIVKKHETEQMYNWCTMKLNSLEETMNVLEDQVNLLREQLLWDKELIRIFTHLKIDENYKALTYGRNLYWLLCLTLFLSMNQDEEKFESFASKVSKISGKNVNYQIIKNIFTFVSTVMMIEEKQIIQNIASKVSSLEKEPTLSKQAIDSVLVIMTEEKYISMLENGVINLQFFKKKEFSIEKDKIFEMISEVSDEEKPAFLDTCIMVILLIKGEAKVKNPIKQIAKELIQEKKGKEKTIGSQAKISKQIKETRQIQTFDPPEKEQPIHHEETCCSGCIIM